MVRIHIRRGKRTGWWFVFAQHGLVCVRTATGATLAAAVRNFREQRRGIEVAIEACS